MSFLNVLGDLLSLIRRILNTLFARRITNSLLIFVKTNTGTVVPVGLDPKWEVRDIKEFVAPKLGMTPEEVCCVFFLSNVPRSRIAPIRFTFVFVVNDHICWQRITRLGIVGRV